MTNEITEQDSAEQFYSDVVRPKDTIAPVITELVRSAYRSMDHDRGAARRSLQRAVTLLDAARSEDLKASSSENGGLVRWQLLRVIAYIDANLNRRLPCSELAALLNLSSGHFSRSFTRSQSVTPRAFIQSRRLAAVQVAMLTTDAALSDIAIQCGFADQSHLSRVFRELVGVPPNQWRRHKNSLPPSGSEHRDAASSQ